MLDELGRLAVMGRNPKWILQLNFGRPSSKIAYYLDKLQP